MEVVNGCRIASSDLFPTEEIEEEGGEDLSPSAPPLARTL